MPEQQDIFMRQHRLSDFSFQDIALLSKRDQMQVPDFSGKSPLGLNPASTFKIPPLFQGNFSL
jgi:hypothetical protein